MCRNAPSRVVSRVLPVGPTTLPVKLQLDAGQVKLDLLVASLRFRSLADLRDELGPGGYLQGLSPPLRQIIVELAAELERS